MPDTLGWTNETAHLETCILSVHCQVLTPAHQNHCLENHFQSFCSTLPTKTTNYGHMHNNPTIHTAQQPKYNTHFIQINK